jgi:hypothetical protein
MTSYYKVLRTDLTPYHGGSGQWTVGEWMPAIDNPERCDRGYHLIDREHLIEWLGPAIHPAEGRGAFGSDDGKTTFAEAKIEPALANWTERTARLFACDCAERVLPVFEDKYPNDERPRQAIAMARRFANDKAPDEELTAARAAAWAAWDAAWDAALVAQDTVGAVALAAARDAAWAAALAAARDADRAAAWAAEDAERKWQTDRLFDYLEGRAL